MIDPPAWMEARCRRAAVLDELMERLLRRFGSGGLEYDEFRRLMAQHQYQRKMALTHPSWMPDRPPRRMSTALAVAKYWQGRRFHVDVASPQCFACLTEFERWSDMERAHLVDRFLGGLDHEANLVMLCSRCHGVMPMIDVHEVDKALAFVRDGGWLTVVSHLVSESVVVVAAFPEAVADVGADDADDAAAPAGE